MTYRKGSCGALAALALTIAPSALAQSREIAADLLFYGDNGEFVNPYRSGETIFGIAGRVYLEAALNDTVKIRGGLFGGGRFGAHEFLEHKEPMIALELRRGASRFIFGSLETIQVRHDVEGPDQETLHGLLPPIQRETLTYSRGQEMGLQWLVDASRLDHDAWINWQRLNTADHRERFDAGYRARVDLKSTVRAHGQWHVVHEGGQQFGNGAVGDSQAGAVGLEWTRPAPTRVTLDAHVVGTRHVPDRARPLLTRGGFGVFTRGAVVRGPWRSHLIVWRSADALKAEGDANYLALRRDGRVDRKTRDYAELGVTRHFRPAPDLHVLAAVRLHRVDARYEYSYRIVGRLHLRRAW